MMMSMFMVSSFVGARPSRPVGVSGGAFRDGQAGQAPLEHALVEAAGAATSGGEAVDGVVGQDAVGAAAVGDDLDVGGQLIEAVLELLERH
jgi:hypothetical protein